MYILLESYMQSCMEDSVHDQEHIYRVLYHAMQIAEEETGVDYDVLIAACLLHDIGRKDQFADSSLCHAMVGGEKAYSFLTEQGFDTAYAEAVKHCIQTHRFRKTTPPKTLEAKILFDADKLDAVGAMGIARTLLYQGIVGDPLYNVLADGTVSDGILDTQPSFFREYKFKLEKLYSNFYTAKGEELARSRQNAAAMFYSSLLQEVNQSYICGKEVLELKIT